MRRIFLRDCASGDFVDDVYVVTGKQLSATNTGKHFIKALVSDRSQQVTARMWNATREMFNAMPDGGVMKLRGKIENYQGNLQLIIDHFAPAKEGTYEIGDLLPHTKKDIGVMCQRIAEVVGSIQNRHLAALTQAYLDDDKLMADFCRAPAAMTFHHAYIGGLLEHTLNAMEVADAIVKFYPGLNRDLVIAGIFLHDIAKTWELTYESAFGYSDGGQLVGHIVKSAMWVEHKAKEAEAILGEKIPQRLIDVLQHIILSHHNLPEYGAAKTPATPEAIAVHYIEDLDAKMMTSLYATRGEGVTSEGNWTEYMKAFNGRLYRPDVALAEADVIEAEVEISPKVVLAPQSVASAEVEKPSAVKPAADMQPLRINNPLFESTPSRKK